MLPRIVRSPVEICFGTSPSQAPKSRPFENAEPSPITARAQQPAIPVIGFLHVAFPGPYHQQLIAFRQGLKQSGYVEGHNLGIEYRWADNQLNRLPDLAADLVRRRVSVIVAAGGPPS